MKPLEYLSDKVKSVVISSNKVYNEGARLLANFPDWELHLDRIINEAWNTLLKYCVRNKQSSYSAAVKLTFASDLIGKRIARDIGIDETNIKSTLALGDILLETFLQAELIDIFREYNGKRAPYMVRIIGEVDAVRPVLLGTSFVPLEPIRGLRSPLTKEPFIKGWTDAELFHNYIDAPFVRAMDKLRAQAWELNIPVLNTLMANPPDNYLDLVDEDGVIHQYKFQGDNSKLPKELNHLDGTPFLGNKDAKLQRLLSKLFEYNQVISKAQMVKENGGKFWQEISCDYRGRIYYQEPFLEYQGSDIARSLFLFSEEKEVTEKGRRWLFIHAANSYNESYSISEVKKQKWCTTDYSKYLKEEGLDTISVDKMKLEDKYQWTVANIHRFVSWNSTLGCTQPVFQPNAEKPYAFLAALYEICRMMDHPDGFKSKLPLPIDGSNNGKP